MNATLNLAIVFLGPLVVVTAVAVIRWLVDRDPIALGGRLRRWGFWATIASYGFFAAVMTLSMALHGEDYSFTTTLAAAALFAGLPLGTRAWQHAGGLGLPVAVSVAVGGLCALAAAVTASPQSWTAIQEGGFPLVSVVAMAVGASAAVWGRQAPVPAGVALLAAGLLPLGACLIGSAAADVVLVEMFAPMPMFAAFGGVLLAATWIERHAERREGEGASPGGQTDRTMAA